MQKEKPLPFFLHCDDVEYGLRLGTVPMAGMAQVVAET